MYKSSSSWIERLDGCPGLNLEEKSRARVIILSKPRADRELYFEGTWAEVAATICALLKETQSGAERSASASGASRNASGAGLISCSWTNTNPDGSGTSRSGTTTDTITWPSSATSSDPSDPSASTSTGRPPASEILIRTAASVRHLAVLPSTFRAAHFWASQPGDIYCRTVKRLVRIPAGSSDHGSSDGDSGDGTIIVERGETRFAIVVDVSPPPFFSSLLPSTSASSSSSSISTPSSSAASAATGSGCTNKTVVAVKVRGQELSRRWSAASDGGTGGSRHPADFEAEVVPDPRDGLAAVQTRLDRREVQMADVIIWRESPGKWTLWDGSPQRSWCSARW